LLDTIGNSVSVSLSNVVSKVDFHSARSCLQLVKLGPFTNYPTSNGLPILS